MPLSSFEKTNLKSKKMRTFPLILLGIFLAYLCGFGTYLSIRVIGESHPETWDSVVTLINGMSIKFSLAKAGPLFNGSIAFFFISIVFGASFLLLRWHILRAGVLATALLSLAHLGCAILLLVLESWLAHAFILGLLAILFVAGFIANSNILIYFQDRAYPDLVLESVVAAFFLFFIGRMLVMALMGGAS